MRTAEPGRKLIKSYESLRLTSYRDGGGVWTIGWGHTKGVRGGQKITVDQAEAFLVDDLRRAESAINVLVSVPLTQNQFDALVSLAFNIGNGAFKESTLRKRLNAGRYDEAARQFLVWNKDSGKVVRGLVRRRAQEQALFLSA